MPTGPEALRLHAERMASLTNITDESTRTLVRGWVRTWDQSAGDFQDALEIAASRLEAGQRLTWRQMNDIERFAAAMRRVAQRLDDLAATGRVQIADAAGDAVQVAREFEPRIIAAQFPNVGPETAALAAQLSDRVSGGALDRIVARTEDRIVSRLQPLSAEAQANMRRALVRGITVGDNPRETARRMLRGLEREFNGGMVRALRVARTEQLDAYRTANGAIDQANGDVVSGWTWVSALDATSCIACIDMHGTEWATEDPGPEGHVNCRCDRVPRTKSWRELGFDVDEPPSLLPDKAEWFDGLDEPTQRSIMGPGRLDAYRSGEASWGQFAKRVENPDWRPSWQVTPLKDLGVEPAMAGAGA